ncbi:MAG TPA: hypothetical protein VGD54_08110 [Steroidobacteraceae bacterium]
MSDSFVNTPIARVSFSRCSSEPKSSVGDAGASGGVAFATDGAAGAGFLDADAAVVPLGLAADRPEGAPGDAVVCEVAVGGDAGLAVGGAGGMGAGVTGAGAAGLGDTGAEGAD